MTKSQTPQKITKPAEKPEEAAPAPAPANPDMEALFRQINELQEQVADQADIATAWNEKWQISEQENINLRRELKKTQRVLTNVNNEKNFLAEVVKKMGDGPMLVKSDKDTGEVKEITALTPQKSLPPAPQEKTNGG